jgi:putative membrane protein
MLRLTLAVLHLIALGLGLYAVVVRGTALRDATRTTPAEPSLRTAFRADAAWGIAAILWIATGLWRLFAGTEKPTTYYVHNHLFMAKMGFLVLILVLEVSPMLTLIRWRRARAAGTDAATLVQGGAAGRIAIISHVQALLVVGMIVCASAMARGYGGR